MKRTALAVIAALLGILGFTAAPASAGNGTNNFYLSGSCSDANPGKLTLRATNYDNGANQIYHTAWYGSSGATGVRDALVYIDDYYRGSGNDMFLSAPGHGRFTLKVEGYSYYKNQWRLVSCSFRI